MKKKTFTLITACLTMLVGSNIVWGQHGVLLPEAQEQVTPRRGDLTSPIIPINPLFMTCDTIGLWFHPTEQFYAATSGYENVNNEFGAGESAIVKTNKVVFPSQVPGGIAFTNSPEIRLGSTQSQNVVINTYNAGGYASGWLNIDVWATACTGSFTNAPSNATMVDGGQLVITDKGNDMTGPPVVTGGQMVSAGDVVRLGNGYKGVNATQHLNISLSSQGGNLSALDYVLGYGTMETMNSVTLYMVQHGETGDGTTGTYTFNKAMYKTPYTSTGEYITHTPAPNNFPTLKDNDVWLFQYAGNKLISTATATAGSVGNAPVPSGDDRYRRPTTVAIDGTNSFNRISISDVNWFYQQHEIRPFASGPAMGLYYDTQDWSSRHVWDCCHYIGNSITSAESSAGYSPINILVTQIPEFTSLQPEKGDGLLDAAVQIIAGAKVCVETDVADNTSTQASVTAQALDSKTDAILVLPAEDRYSLRVAGSFVEMNMAHDDSVTTANVLDKTNKLYKAENFPVASGSIFLTPSFVSLSDTYGASRPLGSYGLTGWSIAAPSISTESSIFGVGGNYEHTGATTPQIYTGGATNILPSVINASYTLENNPGVIEVGTSTTGQENFHVYSGGTIKNFESDCAGPNTNFSVNFGVYGAANAPSFTIDSLEPLYILNYGNNSVSGAGYLADINFANGAITNLNTALNGSQTGTGALHIQARGDVRFIEGTALNLQATNKNEVRILSDEASILLKPAFTFNESDSNLIVWAKGLATDSPNRSCIADTGKNQTGMVYFGDVVNLTLTGKGFTLVRSEYDDVLLSANAFDYTNSTAAAGNGEFMMQAGQDIYGQGDLKITQAGEKSILLEAKNSIHTKGNVLFDRTNATTGNITMKAGYNTFNISADPNVSLWGDGICSPNNYTHRTPCTSEAGSDIWFEGAGTVTFTIPTANNFNTTMRAYNSIFVDPVFTYTNSAANTDDTHLLMFAETGNVEAIKNSNNTVAINMTDATNETLIRIQAGNKVSMANVNDMTTNERYPSIEDAGPKCNNTNFNEWDGNILFNKPFNITHAALGQTLISAERDIENQVDGPMTFTYTNTALENPFLMTAGRHIETHKDVTFDYTGAGTATTGNITMQAGRLNHSTSKYADNLCKVDELGSTLTESDNVTPYNPASHTSDNDFSKGGKGQGSILLFAPLKFTYQGEGNILMTALNGDISSDPYLHGNYKAATGAPMFIDHNNASGETTLEAIDIRLHDVFTYDATTGAATKDNGKLNFHAFDSILTRDITYKNLTDNGSVYITTDKYKNLVAGGCSGSITQGHIVLGYGADKNSSSNANDQILFDFGGLTNTSATGASLFIRAGYEGFAKHADKKNQYGGNITYDYLTVIAANGNHKTAGYMELSTPNGNIWGKDFMDYTGFKGDLLVDAGKGSNDDPDAIAWKNDDNRGINQDILNTSVPKVCSTDKEWRTGNIMMKGGSLNFNNEDGNATFRTREGYIDTYDAFDVNGMKGQLLKYAHAEVADNQYGDVGERDFVYTPAGGSVYYGADDNIMFNYGNSNGTQNYTNNIICAISGDYAYDGNALHASGNPYYSTLYGNSKFDADYAKFNVNTNGYLFYKTNYQPINKYHYLYRGGHNSCLNSGLTGTCATPSNGARDITMDFSVPNAGGFAAVANNYVDFFTKFTYKGGQGSGMVTPTVGTIINESVTGYGLLLKSRHDGVQPEARRVTCFNCNKEEEWPSVTFHDDARIHTEGQISVLEGPVIEFFGHAELDAYSNTRSKSKLTVKADSLIFHDSAIFDGSNVQLLPFTTSGRGMRHGVVNDANYNMYKEAYGQAISMHDREVPVLELGYQRCNEPDYTPNSAANRKDVARVGGDVIVAVKNGFDMPIFNTVVANHARISFIDDMIDGYGNVYRDANVRTDLLRIRNKVEFYTDPSQPDDRRGVLKMTSDDQMPTQRDAGLYTRRIHMEPGSELSIPGEDSLIVISTTVVGGYGEIHENIMVKANGVIAPGYASMMECDCTSGCYQGKMTMHNLSMEKDAQMRISISGNNGQYNPLTGNYDLNRTQTDTLYVQDSIFFAGKIPLYVLTEDASIDPGCYLFLKYDDTLGVSMERAKNLELVIDRYGDRYFSLVHSKGEVRLCVSTSPDPVVKRYIEVPAVTGVTTVPNAGTHYVDGQQTFTLFASYTGAPYKVIATNVYSKQKVELLGEKQSDGSYKYEIRFVVEPWTLAIGPDFATNFVDNDIFGKASVWAYGNTLYIKTDKKEIASIYSMTGILQQRVEIPEGQEKITLERGIYVVTLSDGSVHKIVVK